MALFNAQRYDDPEFWQNFVGSRKGGDKNSFVSGLKGESSNKNGNQSEATSASSEEQRQRSLKDTIKRTPILENVYGEEEGIKSKEFKIEKVKENEERTTPEFVERLRQTELQTELNKQIHAIRIAWERATSMVDDQEKSQTTSTQEKENSVVGMGAWALQIMNERSMSPQGRNP